MSPFSSHQGNLGDVTVFLSSGNLADVTNPFLSGDGQFHSQFHMKKILKNPGALFGSLRLVTDW